jgi:small-conductance mechanosensitive channel
MKKSKGFSGRRMSSVAACGFLRTLATLLGVAVLMFCLVVGTVGLLTEDFKSEAFSAALALGIALLGGVAGLLVIDLARGTAWEAWSSLVAMGVRMVLTLLLLAGFFGLAKGLVTIRLLLYLIFFYAVILSFETFVSVRELQGGSTAAKSRRTGTSGVRGDQSPEAKVSYQEKD